MNLTAVIMVKNEIDVIRECCGHLSALFDHIVIIDHRSTDGTRQYLEKLSEGNEKFYVCYFTEPGYFQSQLMTWTVKSIRACRDANWVFLLDADEVLPFTSRAQFENALDEYEDTSIIKMAWKNLIPKDYSIDGIMGREYLEPMAASIYHKIAYQPSLLPISDYIIAQGNHAVYAGLPGKELPSVDAFNIFHVPVRSSEQLKFKVDQGTAAYSQMGENRNKLLGSHWFQIAEHVQRYGLDEAFLNGLALHYGESTDVKKINMPYEDIIKMGGQAIKLDMALEKLPDIDNVSTYQERVLALTEDMKAMQSNVSDSDVNKSIIINAVREISFMDNSNKPQYNSLEWRVLSDKVENDNEFITSFLEPSTWAIESLTPTAWGGHIPFMFSLVTLMKPRIFTELGSHNGASFFAACQAFQRNDLKGKTVAVDLWQGDEHAGFYGETVYNKFQHILNALYFDVGESLRMNFDDASDLFEENSIDLLHIDGLHTYEAVKNDYVTWKSKVSKNGVIIFHDTAVHERGFGVWKLWDEIKGDAVSFNFKHTHGLGVLAFGNAEQNPVVRLLELVNSSEHLRGFMEAYFSRLGELSTLEAISKYRDKTDAVSQTTRSGRISHKLAMAKNAFRARLVNFVKSIPVLRELAYKVQRFVRG